MTTAFILGLSIGACFGVVAASLAIISKDNSND